MIKKWYKYYILKESIKDIELNRILDKISNKEILSIRETNFLDLYNQTQDNDMKDYSYLSRNLAYDKIKSFLKKDKKIYCDLCDRDGKISDLILDIEINDFKLILKHGTFLMKDNLLYNIKYNMKKDEYSLLCQDEYYEKIEIIK